MQRIRLYPIYYRDLVSFLPRKKIDELRLVCRIYDSRILSIPNEVLPRRRLGIFTLMATNTRLSSNTISTDIFDCEETDACALLKNESGKLVGQLIFSNLPAAVSAVFCLERNRAEMKMEVMNVLTTDDEVFRLVHFLHHLRNVVFGRITGHLAFWSREQLHPLLNSTIIEFLDAQHDFPLYKLFAAEYRNFPDHSPMSVDELKSVQRWINFRATPSYCKPEDVPMLLDLITAAGGRRSTVRRVNITALDFTTDSVETTIVHFKNLEPHKWDGVVSEVIFDFRPCLPPSIPPSCCTTKMESDEPSGGKMLHFNLINASERSDHTFRVIFYTNSRSQIEKMRLVKLT